MVRWQTRRQHNNDPNSVYSRRETMHRATSARMKKKKQNTIVQIIRKTQSLYTLSCIISMCSECDHRSRHLLWPRLKRRANIHQNIFVFVCAVRTSMLKNKREYDRRRWFDRSVFEHFIPFPFIALVIRFTLEFEVSVFGSMPFWSFSSFHFYVCNVISFFILHSFLYCIWIQVDFSLVCCFWMRFFFKTWIQLFAFVMQRSFQFFVFFFAWIIELWYFKPQNSRHNLTQFIALR